MCVLEDKAAQQSDLKTSAIFGYQEQDPSGKKRTRWQGQLEHPVLGEASLRPSSIADLDAKTKRGLSEQ